MIAVPARRRLLVVAAPLIAAGTGAVVFAIVRPTVMPDVGFWDTGEFQTVGPLLGTAHPTGYPSYVILGWLASVVLQPIGEPALRMNVLSALLVAFAATTTVWLVRALTGRLVVGAACGLVLGTMPIVWRVGTHADPHALHVVLVAVILGLLVTWENRRRTSSPGADRWLVAAAVAYGVALGNQGLTVLLAPGIAACVLAVEPRILARRDLVVRCALALSVTALVLYLELPLRAGPFPAPLVYGHPDTPIGLLYVMFGAQFLGGLDPIGDLGGKLGTLADIAGHELGALALLLPFAFLVTWLRRPAYALLSGSTLALTCWFAVSYENADIERYFLGPAVIALSWLGILASTLVDAVEALGGAGGASVRRPGHLARGGVVSRSAAAAATVATAAALSFPGLTGLDAHRLEVDESGDRAARDWLEDALDRIDRDAVVVSW
ncbi:MAG TPA: DUF2723 domain-containing protein, partial [Candidatus Limnocylindrales bacterium]